MSLNFLVFSFALCLLHSYANFIESRSEPTGLKYQNTFILSSWYPSAVASSASKNVALPRLVTYGAKNVELIRQKHGTYRASFCQTRTCPDVSSFATLGRTFRRMVVMINPDIVRFCACLWSQVSSKTCGITRTCSFHP